MHLPTTKLLILLIFVTAAATGTALCVPRECDALLAFKCGITDDPAGRLSSWRQGSDCCRWRGVRCSNQTGHVLQLRLGNNEAYRRHYDDRHIYDAQRVSPVSDSYPSDEDWIDTAMGGEINPSIFSLEHLEHLDIGMNSLNLDLSRNSQNLNLRGSSLHFPIDGQTPGLFSLGSLKSLRYLSLSKVGFADGLFPTQLGNLSKLQYLDLSSTTFSIQQKDMSSLTRLTLLHHLDLSGVNLSMVHDWPHIMNMIPSLQVLYLSYCFLQNANHRLPHLNFTRLERLDLSDNFFYQPSDSCWFWNLTGLRYLNLGSNNLYGQFPSRLGQMKLLQVFDFSNSKYVGDGSVTAIIAPRLMRNLCDLEVLNLEGSLSYGDMIELYESLPHCSPNKLRELHLGGNNITGSLPAGIDQFSSLVTLDLSVNHLTGNVPSEIGMLNNLMLLDLGHNKLTGVITAEHFSSLTSLRAISLSDNLLKIVVDPGRLPTLRLEVASFAYCKMGPGFPSWLRRLAGIDYIDLSNTGITGHIPYWFSTTFSQATYLDLADNQINGSLPNNMEIMSLNLLHLDRNKISGEIPALPRNLTSFSISNNALSGRIPGSMCKSQELELLDLSNNHLEGGFPQCLEKTQLVFLILSNNMFSGKFPPFLQSCTYINFLDLSGNKLSGRLPTWIGDLTDLEYLRLNYNMFSGSIPFSITNLEQMYDFNLAGNRFSGTIPLNLSCLTTMTKELGPNDNYYNLSVITKRKELHYAATLSEMVTIDLSSNYLTGTIPEEISSLVALMNLNLSWNYLTGNIPQWIGSLSLLESLDLSRNKLSGEIPSSLSNMTYLACLDLSYNNLSGRIPSGSQLDTLYDNNPYMYSGNDGLCGPPLQRICPGGNNATRLGDGDRKRSEHVPDLMFFHFGLGSGFIVGLWVVFCTMLFKQTWRVAYFTIFDKVYEKIYVFGVVTRARLAEKTVKLIRKLG